MLASAILVTCYFRIKLFTKVYKYGMVFKIILDIDCRGKHIKTYHFNMVLIGF